MYNVCKNIGYLTWKLKIWESTFLHVLEDRKIQNPAQKIQKFWENPNPKYKMCVKTENLRKRAAPSKCFRLPCFEKIQKKYKNTKRAWKRKIWGSVLLRPNVSDSRVSRKLAVSRNLGNNSTPLCIVVLQKTQFNVTLLVLFCIYIFAKLCLSTFKSNLSQTNLNPIFP